MRTNTIEKINAELGSGRQIGTILFAGSFLFLGIKQCYVPGFFEGLVDGEGHAVMALMHRLGLTGFLIWFSGVLMIFASAVILTSLMVDHADTAGLGQRIARHASSACASGPPARAAPCGAPRSPARAPLCRLGPYPGACPPRLARAQLCVSFAHAGPCCRFSRFNPSFPPTPTPTQIGTWTPPRRGPSGRT